MQKMPYKHIAAHLKKTELACRLHYHQLTHGNHRRRRTSTSTNSSTSSTSSRYSISQLPLPSSYDPTVAFAHHSNGYQYTANPYSTINTSPDRVQHKVLLPKPASITPDSSPDHLRGLGNHTLMSQQSSVDTDRLHAIYNNHRSNFWASIAAEYGSQVSPTHLEDIWRQNTNGTRRPPTPGDSPNRGGQSMMKQTPAYPHYGTATFDQKDYGPVGQLLSAMPDTRFADYQFAATTSTYGTIPSLPPLERQHTWPNAATPATAITSLLNDDKCSRSGEFTTPRY
jgi:hypothetical protein